MTQTTLVVHGIDTGDSKPIKQKTRPIPIVARKEFKGIIKDLLERKVIEPSSSEWASPVVLVKKKDGTLRLCIDYRQLNKVTKQDSYPLPTIDAVLQSLSGKKVFSTLDMASGYWQIKLTEEAKAKSAFTTSEGLFQFTALPFGLCTSPAVFQRMMDRVQEELHVKDVNIDDILVATESLERHYEVLEKVLQCMRRANLRLKPQKCKFVRNEVSFLGHKISEKGVQTDLAKIEEISRYPQPVSVRELRTFLGMASYYRKFIMGFSKIAKSLYNLTSPKTPWKWAEQEELAFEKLKKTTTQAPILAQPNVQEAQSGAKPFVIYTDTSTGGLGAELCQEGKDKLLHPVFLASKGLTKAEKNYHVTELEALALVFALKKFHFFIYGLPTIIGTDHQSLTSLFKRTNVSAKVLRWALEVQKYNLKMHGEEEDVQRCRSGSRSGISRAT